MATSNLALVLNVAACGLYGYSAYYLTYNPTVNKMHGLMDPKLRIYGQLKFLTFQCLLIQLVSAILHVLAHFIRPLRKPRDLVFTGLAYPIGSVVCYTFWAVWHIMGRELIFPAALSQFYPDWLNHATHTVIAPFNIILSIVLYHKYSRNGVLLALVHSGLYTVFLHYIKFKTGFFVYKFLDALDETERLVYFAVTGLFTYGMYKTGQLLTHMAHSRRSATDVKSKQQKQKQK